ncbi:MAG: family 16 glycosylhydrolase [Candidatus Eisenbacteria bacterium]|uniref:Family 16 glycosylhydrolase n=1 Tax=Eiseniibacteriota bacterium TaxID=2212470 RepID=A0A956SG77_UNCEI|nr:family 16 glycosylhydrolase [Candidatus Eisenbacteria bacterium]
MLRNLALVALLMVGSGLARAQEYQLVWADDFDGTEVDTEKWEFQTGTGCPDLCGWGNNELQNYRPENATVAGGFLTIQARNETGEGYTSARLRTRYLGDWTYGRLEMRAKLPIGQGLWPAFWMLPTDEVYGTWAASGEIDIMEAVGQEPSRVIGTLHYGGTWPDNTYTTNSYDLPSGTFHDDFHEFALEWEPCEIRWYVDGEVYATQDSWYSTGGPFPAPFDERFHVLLNLAVGGNLPGPPDQTTVFPQDFVIDYVRVYRPAPDVRPCLVEFDGMDHGDPFGNDWFVFGGAVGGGGIDPNFVDLPPVDGCRASLQSGWGSGGTPGFFGGFGRTHRLDLSDATHFTFWIHPDAGQDYTLEINLQDDDDGDDQVPSSPNGEDDEFQFDFRVSPTGPGAISGGGWQYVSLPLSEFFDDNSFHWGGNGVFDPIAVDNGGNGRLVNVVVTVIGESGSDATFRTDRWAFTRQTGTVQGTLWEDLDGDGFADGGEPRIANAILELLDPRTGRMETANTSASGDYAFFDLGAARYEVRVDPSSLPSGLTPSFDPDGIDTENEFALLIECDEAALEGNFGYLGESSAVDEAGQGLGDGWLGQSEPNPFRAGATISFQIGKEGWADLSVFDVGGREIRVLVHGEFEPGRHVVSWDGRDESGNAVAEGVYYYRLTSRDGTYTRRMTVLGR